MKIKNVLRKGLATFLAAVFVFSMPVTAFPLQSEELFTIDYLSNEFIEAVRVFEEDYGFSHEFSVNYVRTTLILDDLRTVLPLDSAGQFILPHYIGGIYINDDGILVIQSANRVALRSASLGRLEQIADFGYVIFEEVRFSHRELTEMFNKLVERGVYDRESGNHRIIGGSGILETENRVRVWLYDYSPEGIEYFRATISDSPMIIFEPLMPGWPTDIDEQALRLAFDRLGYEETLRWLQVNHAFDDRANRHAITGDEALAILQELAGVEEGISIFPFLQYQYLYSSSPSYISPAANLNLLMGQRIYAEPRAGTPHFGSAGFSARHISTGRVGLVTAGHVPGNARATDMFAHVSLPLGRVDHSLFRDDFGLDAAFIEMMPFPTILPSNQMLGGGQLAAGSTGVVIGSVVNFRGATTSRYNPGQLLQTGRVTAVNQNIEDRRSNQVITNLDVLGGDSGGVVYIPWGAGNNLLVGIVQGGRSAPTQRPPHIPNNVSFSRNMNFTPASSILATFGLIR
ncbi:MAG: S1 family peptidase [Clostridiales bacterium]|jgi:hypothetical protein|nr:S1 family peptidase [Clostridiales bacterium]